MDFDASLKPTNQWHPTQKSPARKAGLQSLPVPFAIGSAPSEGAEAQGQLQAEEEDEEILDHLGWGEKNKTKKTGETKTVGQLGGKNKNKHKKQKKRGKTTKTWTTVVSLYPSIIGHYRCSFSTHLRLDSKSPTRIFLPWEKDKLHLNSFDRTARKARLGVFP